MAGYEDLVVTSSLSRVFALTRRVGRPQGQVVTQQLHDQGRVLVAVLVKSVQLSNGVVKCLKEFKACVNSA